ncbi:MAG TPA: glycoside hydrolase family 16 protein [Chthonomonadaceae bacterium]|nr:glycoside hydrolase family 16 protein [Chthonomonadaceae bacterium]
MYRFALFCLLTSLAGLAAAPAAAKTIRFSGYDWEVRGAGKGGPGPNQWDDANVWLDEKGRLHVKISQVDGEWRCAELQTRERLGFGTYTFQVTGRLDNLDPNVVLGLFTYPTRDVGGDGTNEIDIEFARWGRMEPAAANMDFVVYPSSGKRQREIDNFTGRFLSPEMQTTHRFTWTAKGLSFLCAPGRAGKAAAEPPEGALRWQFQPADARLVPHDPCPVHLNLWLFRGHAPLDGKPVEIVIDSFRFEKT